MKLGFTVTKTFKVLTPQPSCVQLTAVVVGTNQGKEVFLD